jgi:hypothetical protein
MTNFDTFVVAIAVIQIVAVILMGMAGFSMMETAKRGQKVWKPALDEAKAIATVGSGIARNAAQQGTAAAARVKAITELVKRRVDTTVRIAKEIKPGANGAASELQQQRASALDAARKVGGLARSVNRVRSAVESAARAAKEG